MEPEEHDWYWIVWEPNIIPLNTDHNVDIYGTRKAKTYSINYSVWSGTKHNNPTTYECGKELVFLPATYDGYFVFWNQDTIPAKYDTDQVTITAKYVEKTFAQCLENDGWYHVATANQVKGMQGSSFNANTKVRLYSNIDVSNVAWSPIEDFRGVFDGNGYTITYKNENIDPTYSFGFMRTNYGTIQNLNIKAKVFTKLTKRETNASYYMSDKSIIIDPLLIDGLHNFFVICYIWEDFMYSDENIKVRNQADDDNASFMNDVYFKYFTTIFYAFIKDKALCNIYKFKYVLEQSTVLKTQCSQMRV